MKYYFVLLIFLTCITCRNRETKYRYFCAFGASSPTDLMIINSSSQAVQVDLLVDENGIKKFGGVHLGAFKQRKVCIENEGRITAGLYILANGEQTKVVLNSSATNMYYVETKEFKTEY